MAHLQRVASSSSASPSTAATPNSNYNYDVFINNFSPEVKKPLASYLYHRLLLDRFRVFFDRQERQAGDGLKSEIEGAIATASVHIAIFSPGYVESKYCLDELLLMLKSKAPVIPVFYHVKRSDLQLGIDEGEDGVYGRALRNLEKRYKHNTCTVWREALSRVADISGLELEACNGDEAELVDRVVQWVEKKVTKTQLLASYGIGLDEKLQGLENTVLLQQQQHGLETAIVGIVGPGGIGKTTVAMEFFKRRRSDYSHSCFLSDVREAAGRNSLPSLQNKLINCFNPHPHEPEIFDRDLEIADVADCKERLRHHLLSSKALIVLDDVDAEAQLLAFFSQKDDVLCYGSLILVTSRSEDVLTTSGIKKPFIYTLRGLNKGHSEELFCLHAFHKRLPVFGFEEVVGEFLDVCNGSPLALKVLGALLHQKDLKYWKTSLREISVLPADIENILKIGYYGLDDEEKEMFLDIVSFFINENKDMAITIWDASGWEGRLNLENLKNNCLVEIDSENFIRMHDHLRDLGRDLAEKQRFDCRFWRPTDRLFRSASEKLTVRGINMVQEGSASSFEKPVDLSNSFVDMSRLQLLRAEGNCLESIWNRLGHSDLFWLCWNRYPNTALPSWIPIRNLRVLQVDGGKLETLWQTESEAPLELRELNISAAILRFPESIGKLEHLEKIVVKARIEPLPEEFVHLRSLKYLSLQKGTSRSSSLKYIDLEMLPQSFGNLTNLQHLDLSGCFLLRMLPESFENLTNLQHLHLSACSSLKELPSSLGNLPNLQHLDLSACSSLKELPSSLGNLPNLQHLELSACSGLQTLPDSLGNLTNLQHLDLSGCSDMQTLPDSLGNLTNLQHLNLSWCSGLRTLPDSLGDLRNLQRLDLSGCSCLRALPDSLGDLRNLQRLALSGCSRLRTLSDSLGDRRNLECGPSMVPIHSTTEEVALETVSAQTQVESMLATQTQVESMLATTQIEPSEQAIQPLESAIQPLESRRIFHEKRKTRNIKFTKEPRIDPAIRVSDPTIRVTPYFPQEEKDEEYQIYKGT